MAMTCRNDWLIFPSNPTLSPYAVIPQHPAIPIISLKNVSLEISLSLYVHYFFFLLLCKSAMSYYQMSPICNYLILYSNTLFSFSSIICSPLRVHISVASTNTVLICLVLLHNHTAKYSIELFFAFKLRDVSCQLSVSREPTLCHICCFIFTESAYVVTVLSDCASAKYLYCLSRSITWNLYIYI